MKVAIRADASAKIGSGHVMRMLSLARALKKRGCSVYFLTCDLVGNLNHIIYPEFHLINLSDDKINTLTSVLAQKNFDWLVIDHYQISNTDEAFLNKHLSLHILCVDDNFSPHTCDILLNQNIYATPKRYKELLDSSTKLLTGLSYALIRDEFQKFQNLPRKNNTPPRLLITLGGSDPDNLLLHILNALKNVSSAFEATIVCGPANQHFATIKEFSKKTGNIHVIQKTTEMATLMHEHDCAITASGSSTIESLLMRLPSIVIPIAQNQQEIADTLDKQNLAIKAMWTPQSSLNEMRDVIENFLTQGYKDLRFPLSRLNITPDGADVVADKMIIYKE